MDRTPGKGNGAKQKTNYPITKNNPAIRLVDPDTVYEDVYYLIQCKPEYQCHTGPWRCPFTASVTRDITARRDIWFSYPHCTVIGSPVDTSIRDLNLSFLTNSTLLNHLLIDACSKRERSITDHFLGV